jgi:hypothetical protein
MLLTLAGLLLRTLQNLRGKDMGMDRRAAGIDPIAALRYE